VCACVGQRERVRAYLLIKHHVIMCCVGVCVCVRGRESMCVRECAHLLIKHHFTMCCVGMCVSVCV